MLPVSCIPSTIKPRQLNRADLVDRLRHRWRSLHVESLEERLPLTCGDAITLCDYGDAPSPYATTTADNGPRHIASGPSLGVLRDTESTAQASLSADADDLLGTLSDEDGVWDVAVDSQHEFGTVTVSVHHAPNGARLDAWIDFNRDGSWSGAWDQIANNLLMDEGTQVVRFVVPRDVSLIGDTIGRFRLSTAGGLGTTGEAVDGEVEDHRFAIAAPPVASGQFQLTQPDFIGLPFTTNNMDVVDLDRDGDLDIVASSHNDPQFRWYEQTSESTWFGHVIDMVATGPRLTHLMDVNRDGYIDIVGTVRSLNGQIVTAFLLNDGQQQFTLQYPSLPLLNSNTSLFADMDQDGDLDVLDATSRAIVWYEHLGELEYRVARELITFNTLRRIVLIDWDVDGDCDIITESNGSLRLWLNNGAQVYSPPVTLVSNVFLEWMDVRDYDADGDFDILAQSVAREFIWYEGSNNSQQMVSRPVYGENDHFATQLVDVDGDRDLDWILKSTQNVSTKWLENRQMQPVVVHQLAESQGNELFVADLEGDGDKDLLVLDDYNVSISLYRQVDNRVQITAAQVQVWEHQGTAAMRLTRNGRVDLPLVIDLSVDGSAILGVDYYYVGSDSYSSDRATITFGAGQTIVDIPFQIVDDGDSESRETIRLSLLETSQATGDPSRRGEIMIIDNEIADAGDAPVSYPVLAADDGARHGSTGPRIGVARDAELDGNPSPLADAEPSDDGVEWSRMPVGKLGASASVMITNAPFGALLDAWIDFDNNGSWDGVTERILARWPVVAGDNIVSFDVPATAIPGPTYARVRLSTGGSAAPRGFVADGEVEDYLIEIAPPSPSTTLYPQTGRVISDLFAFGLAPAVDIDGDTDMDFVFKRPTSPHYGWLENQGSGQFQLQTLGIESYYLDLMETVDWDMDGDFDLLVMEYRQSVVAWYENNGSAEFTRHVIAEHLQFAQMTPADMDLDGDPDLVAVDANGVVAVWYANTQLTLGDSQVLLTRIPAIWQVADLDQDGDLDVVGTTSTGSGLQWYRNDGLGQLFEMTLYQGNSRIADFALSDINRDGHTDVALALVVESPQVWLEGDGAMNFSPQPISQGNDRLVANQVTLADIDGDADIDIAYSTSVSSTIVWYQNQGFGFLRHDVGEVNRDSIFVLTSDVDQDGYLDFVTVQAANGALVWYPMVLNSVTIASNVQQVYEKDSPTVTVTLRRSGPVDESLIVHFTVGGDAAWTSDYLSSGTTTFDVKTGSMTFFAGVSAVEFLLTIRDDTFAEAREQIQIELVDGDGYTLGTPSGIVTRVVDDEPDDFGDAPHPFPTLAADDGARHAPVGPQLGYGRDAEGDGQPSSGASADEANEIAPGNTGVVFSDLHVGDFNATAVITIENATTGARIDAWIDFDGDGNWDGPWEQIADSSMVVNGDNTISFSVPAAAPPGNHYARVRVSSAGGLSTTGRATDGEVEDYYVAIAPPKISTGAWFQHATEIPVDDTDIRSTVIVDLDRDGDADIVYGHANSSLFWLENDGMQAFTTHRVPNSNYGNLDTEVVDFDRDGDMDIVTTARHAGKVHWHENNGLQEFQQHVIGGNRSGDFGIVVADLDRDGHLDVLSLANNGILTWFHGNGERQFEERILATGLSVFTVDVPIQIQAADFDKDGDVDIFVAATLPSGQFAILRNNGDNSFEPWLILANPLLIAAPQLSDFDLDGDFDLVARHDSRLAWWENKGGSFNLEHVLSQSVSSSPYFVTTTADADGDGDTDVFSASYDETTGNRCDFRMFRNSGDNETFDPTLVTSMACSQLSVAIPIAAGDIDADGDVDLVSGITANFIPPANADYYLTWQENKDNWLIVEPGSGYQLLESSGTPLEVRVSRSGSTLKSMAVTFDVASTVPIDGSYQLLGLDSFVGGVGELSFPSGVRERTLRIRPIDNLVLNDHVQITVALREGQSHAVASNGSVSLLLIDDEPSDYGDAPTQYFTTAVGNGARHGLSGPMLGNARDAELDGTPSANAQGDDWSGTPRDENGVILPILRVGELRASVTVSVRNAPQGARLSAWIDFDHDGSWGYYDERIADNLIVLDGMTVPLYFSVPHRASSGITYARFRLSTDPHGGPNGLVLDGEVEDYSVQVLPPLAAVEFTPSQQFSATVFNDVAPQTIDLDRDGDLDVITANSRGVVWLENDGRSRFTQRNVENSSNSRPVSVVPLDFDGDGDWDIAFADDSRLEIRWLENDGQQRFVPHLLSSGRGSTSILLPGDLDNDGDMDIVVVERNGRSVSWLDNLRNGNVTFRPIIQRTLSMGFPFVELADLDSDGDLDVISNVTAETTALAWHENLGTGTFKERVISTGQSLRYSTIADFNSDGRLDILVVSQLRQEDEFTILVSQPSGEFVAHNRPIPFDSYRRITVGDLDGDGDPDVLVHSSQSPRWYENNDFPQLIQHPLGTVSDTSPFILFGDFNGDKRGDLFVGPVSSQFQIVLAKPVGDFNADGVLDAEDIDSLVTQVAQGGSESEFDVTRDSRVDQGDVFYWIERLYGTLTGDANLDYAVDVADFNVWNSYKFATSGRWTTGDFTSDGVTDIADFNVWNTTKFRTAQLTSASAQLPRATRRVPRSPLYTPVLSPGSVDVAIADGPAVSSTSGHRARDYFLATHHQLRRMERTDGMLSRRKM